jgi:nicotine blue oxidoreductase
VTVSATGAVAGIVLAAGAGRRFGGPKALVRLGDQTLLERSARVLLAGGCTPVVAVLGCPLDGELPMIDNVQVSWNPDWSEGIGASLRHGLQTLGAWPEISAAVVILVDQPNLTPTAIRRVIDAHRGGALVTVATYAGRRGHPVLLDRSTWPGVQQCAAGEQGARAFMRANPDLVTEVACDDAGAPDDIDEPADLARAARALESNG